MVLLQDFEIAVQSSRGLLFLDGVLELRGGHATPRALQCTQQSPLPNELRASMDGSVSGHAASVYTWTTRRKNGFWDSGRIGRKPLSSDLPREVRTVEPSPEDMRDTAGGRACG